ncbi:hypothetical protein V6N11_078952 [Hibiscus sabdariffa]|uniref:Uncharacterized protein n=1 Tax=Hibiscus sabdariffa TaxID=183260 RepID=A0ABR2RU84_9ROSI
MVKIVNIKDSKGRKEEKKNSNFKKKKKNHTNSSGFLRLLYLNSSIKEPPGSILSDKIGLIKFQGIREYGVPR